MGNRIAWIVSSIGALTLAGCMAKQSPPDMAAAAPVVPTPVVSGTVAANAVKVSATVEAVDLKNRMVTLKGPDGRLAKVHVDDSVKNLPQVKKGDQVVATYYESLAYEVRKPGQAEPGVAVASDVATAKPGEKPAGVGAQAVQVTATIDAIDTTANTVTLKGPDGELKTIKVKDPSRLQKVKVGDLVEITYTEALAIAVEPAAKK
jgi:DNA-directed RNA polymerase subunit H (RpoH/RPB5)